MCNLLLELTFQEVHSSSQTTKILSSLIKCTKYTINMGIRNISATKSLADKKIMCLLKHGSNEF